jgi:hypothetical protein
VVIKENHMIELMNNQLQVSFPEVHPAARFAVEFQRTLRVPDDNQEYPLPAGLGSFPLLPVDDFQVPEAWRQHGGVFFPMYKSEAMWINFRASGYPFAVKVAAGKINAVSGRAWSNALAREPQDYVVIPEQRWLDGFSASKDVVRQFVAMPIGEGVTAEGQITGKEEWGGVQLIFYPMKADEYRKRFENVVCEDRLYLACAEMVAFSRKSAYDMGLAPGGRIRQEIAEDPYGFDVWDTSVSSRCFVHLLNSAAYQQITGRTPPTRPISADQYAKAGVPWFDYYVDGKALGGSSVLAGLDGVASALIKKGKKLEDNKPIQIAQTIRLGAKSATVREGNF